MSKKGINEKELDEILKNMKAGKEVNPWAGYLTVNDYEALVKNGYLPVRMIQKGKTRTAMEVKKIIDKDNNEPKGKSYIAKIPVNPEDFAGSICTIVNTAKTDRNENDISIRFSNKGGRDEVLKHPNITEVHDCFMGEYGKIVIEEKVEGIDLDEYIRKKSVNTREDNFVMIFSNIIKAIDFMYSKDIIHRDIKPKNIIFDESKDVVKLTDLQNATNLSGLTSKELPTRGGTEYTHPHLLNAWFKLGEKSKASKRTDLYSLGVTMYEYMTGEKPFDYKIIMDKDGEEIVTDFSDLPLLSDIYKDKLRVKLKVNGIPVKEITTEQHEELLKEAMKKIPKEFRKYSHIVEKLLSTVQEDNDYDASSLQSDIKKAAKGSLLRKLGEVWDEYKTKILGTTTLLLATALITGTAVYINKITPRPVVEKREVQVLSGLEKNISLNPSEVPNLVKSNEKYSAYAVLSNRIEKIVNLHKKLGSNITYGDNPKNIAEMISDVASENSIDLRLFSALYYSCNSTSVKPDELSGKRVGKMLVPETYSLRLIGGKIKYNTLDGAANIQLSASYLHSCAYESTSVVDTFAKYFASQDEIFAAQQKAKNMNYFMVNDGNTIYEGYGKYLSPSQQRLIENAVVWYLLMDDNGMPNFEKGLSDIISSENLFK